MNILTLNKKDKKLFGEISLPASKSISNRVLIINFLSKQSQIIQNLSKADDTAVMKNLLERIEEAKSTNEIVSLDCKNSGTVMRFLIAVLAQQSGKWILTGSERMKDRPIGILVESLQQLGANIRYIEKKGFPPLQIEGQKLNSKEIVIESNVSSQFITALLLIAPTLPKGLRLILKNEISSLPYIKMTLGLMKSFGIKSTFEKNIINIEKQNFQSTEITIEPDWTSAAYWYEMVALSDEADILLKDLRCIYPSMLTLNSELKEDLSSLQGDSILVEIYKSFGVNTITDDQGIRLTKKGKCVTKFDFDFTNYPDLAQSAIVTCATLGIKGAFTGLESLRIKETDRLDALQSELQKCGFNTKIVRSSKFEVRSCIPDLTKISYSKIVNTYQDHRMVMAFAPLAIINASIKIENPEVVSKSYPHFWEDLEKVGFETIVSEKD